LLLVAGFFSNIIYIFLEGLHLLVPKTNSTKSFSLGFIFFFFNLLKEKKLVIHNNCANRIWPFLCRRWIK